jgi:polyhydroxyalkanoate synthesis repressor PhaR
MRSHAPRRAARHAPIVEIPSLKRRLAPALRICDTAAPKRPHIAARALKRGVMSDAEQPGPAPAAETVVIKKYANRRLYNTRSSAYVTLEHLSEMVKEGTDFVVYDAKTNEDITRSVLTQIIFDEESRGPNLLPIQFLRQLIRFYGDSMQAFVPTYLELSLDSFTRQQERMRTQIAGAVGGVPGAGFFEEHVRQNFALFDRAMRVFSPFAFTRPEDAPAAAAEPKPASDTSLDELKRRMEEMQAQIAKLAAREQG